MSNESDCITLGDSDDDLEILDEKITNYGTATAAPKQLELSKDMEETILDSLRKQNVSIPKGNFKLKIFAKNGGKVDLSTLDLSSISNCSLSVKNKNSSNTPGKSSFSVSAPTKQSKAIKEEVKPQPRDADAEKAKKLPAGKEKSQNEKPQNKTDDTPGKPVATNPIRTIKEEIKPLPRSDVAKPVKSTINLDTTKETKYVPKENKNVGNIWRTSFGVTAPSNGVKEKIKPIKDIKDSRIADKVSTKDTENKTNKSKDGGSYVANSSKTANNISLQNKNTNSEKVVDIATTTEISTVKVELQSTETDEIPAKEDMVPMEETQSVQKKTENLTKKPSFNFTETTLAEQLSFVKDEEEKKSIPKFGAIEHKQIKRAIKEDDNSGRKQEANENSLKRKRMKIVHVKTPEVFEDIVDIVLVHVKTPEVFEEIVDIMQDHSTDENKEEALETDDLSIPCVPELPSPDEKMVSESITAEVSEETIQQYSADKVKDLPQNITELETPLDAEKGTAETTSIIADKLNQEDNLPNPKVTVEEVEFLGSVDSVALKDISPNELLLTTPFDESDLLQLLDTSDYCEKSSSNFSPFDDFNLDEIAECISSYKVYGQEDYKLGFIDEINVDKKEKETQVEMDSLQVVPDLEDYIDRNVDTFLTLGSEGESFDDIFAAVPPTDDFLKSAAPTLFEHEDLIPESINCINPLDMEIGIIAEHFEDDFLDISSKFDDMDTSTLSDIEEIIQESEIQTGKSFVSVEVLESILGDNININQLFWKLKEEAYQHFKFSGWKLTHVSMTAAKHITEVDIKMVEKKNEAETFVKDIIGTEPFNDLENLLCDEFPSMEDCFNKSLTELTEEKEIIDETTTATDAINDGGINDGAEICVGKPEDVDPVPKEVDGFLRRKAMRSFVLVKNIPLETIQKNELILSPKLAVAGPKAMYPSSLVTLPTSGPRDFLWQLPGKEFSSLFGLCTHSQAEETRARARAPIAMRLRRYRQGKVINYKVEGGTRKRRDQRRSI